MPKNRITKPFFKVFKKKHSILILKPPREALILARGKPLSRSPSLPWMTASEDALTWEQVKDRGSICWRKSPPLAYGLLAPSAGFAGFADGEAASQPRRRQIQCTQQTGRRCCIVPVDLGGGETRPPNPPSASGDAATWSGGWGCPPDRRQGAQGNLQVRCCWGAPRQAAALTACTYFTLIGLSAGGAAAPCGRLFCMSHQLKSRLNGYACVFACKKERVNG